MEHPQTLEDICKQFLQWRLSKKTSREPIPASLWKSAAMLTKDHSINTVAKTLRLNGMDLKKKAAQYCGQNPAKKIAPLDFIELPSESSAWPTECVIELTDQAGTRMRLTLKGHHHLDILGLIASFREKSR